MWWDEKLLNMITGKVFKVIRKLGRSKGTLVNILEQCLILSIELLFRLIRCWNIVMLTDQVLR